jgi:hypothetical protein
MPDDYRRVQPNPEQFGGLIARGNPSFETIAAKRSHCAQIACLARDNHREAIIALGLYPYHELIQAFDETPHPMGMADRR